MINKTCGILILEIATTCAEKNELFEELEEVYENVSLGYSSKISVKGKGKIKIYQKDGMPSFISNVCYVPNMEHNTL